MKYIKYGYLFLLLLVPVFLISQSGQWVSPGLVESLKPTFTSGSIVFSDGTTLVQNNANLFYDNANNRLGIGTATPDFPIDIESTSSSMIQTRWNDTGNFAPGIRVRRSRGASVGDNTVVQDGDHLGNLAFFGYDGDSFDNAATISAFVDGTPGASTDMPGRLVFFNYP